jgi:hypothetical protein
MANVPVVCVVTDAQRINARKVWGAWGRGENSFVRKLCDIDPQATHETPPTHWLLADSSTTDSDVAILQGFASGDLPPIQPGLAWGQGDVIAAQDALIAINAENLQVYSASGDVVPLDHVNAILASRNLQFVPDEPI